MLTTRKKQNILKNHGRHDNDTGSSEVQVAMLTKRIEELTDHLRTHRKDHGSRRGLIGLVSKRKKLLKYLEQSNKKIFDKTVKALGIKSRS